MIQVGILGGGQLSLMLAQSAIDMGLQVFVMSESIYDPICSLGDRVKWCIGNLKSESDLVKFINSGPQTICFENEFVDIDLLEKVSQRNKSVRFFPELSVIKKFQNKVNQKNELLKLNIPTAEFMVFDSSINIDDWLLSIQQKFQKGYVLKWAMYGYDGKGTFIVSNPNQACQTRQKEFIEAALKKGVQVYAEQKIDFDLEIALVACTSKLGKKNSAFPLVITKQENGICHLVSGPATSFGVPIQTENKIIEYAKSLANKNNLCGVFAIELFYSHQSEMIMVNEIAPRVHNSGHHTIDSMSESQFTAHMKAICNSTDEIKPKTEYYGMVNIIGKKNREINFDQKKQSWIKDLDPDLHLYWYFKKEEKVGRKLGHINIVADSKDDLDKKFTKAKLILEKLENEKTI